VHPYYLTKTPGADGLNEVHHASCFRMPTPDEVISLGTFVDCHAAMAAARKHRSEVNGCYLCCKQCHEKPSAKPT
jgi:hypothetical protein